MFFFVYAWFCMHALDGRGCANGWMSNELIDFLIRKVSKRRPKTVEKPENLEILGWLMVNGLHSLFSRLCRYKTQLQKTRCMCACLLAGLLDGWTRKKKFPAELDEKCLLFRLLCIYSMLSKCDGILPNLRARSMIVQKMLCFVNENAPGICRGLWPVEWMGH